MGYGVVHDQITARVCIEYFTVGHRFLISSDSPGLLGLFWGVAGTAGMSFLFGIGLYYSLYRGPWPRYEIKKIIPVVLIMLLICGVFALLVGIAGYEMSKYGIYETEWSQVLDIDTANRFHGVWFAHIVSYSVGFVGGMLILVSVIYKRKKMLTK